MQHLYFWLSKLRRFLWLSSLVFIITLALLLTLARQLLPYASEYKAEFEAQMTEVFKRPVKIGAVDARLQNFYPTLVLKDVEIVDETTNKTIFSFHEVYAGLSVIKSIRLKQPVFVNLGLNGSSIAIRRDKQGDVSVMGLDISFPANKTNANTEESIRRTLGWLFAQRSLDVKNVSVYIQDEMYGREYFLPYVNALFRNLANRHQVDANIILDPADGREINLAMDLRGNANDVENIKGDVYLAASQLKISNWLGDLTLNDVAIAGGILDVSLWSKWQWLDLQSLDATMAINEGQLDWKKQQDIVHMNKLDMHILYEKQKQGWNLDFAQIAGQLNTTSITPTRTRITKISDDKYIVQSSTIKLDTLSTIAERLPWLKKDQKEMLANLKPQGQIDHLYMTYEPGQAKSINASFNVHDFGMESYKKIPLLRGVSGTVWLDNQGGSIQVDTRNMRFHQKHAYREPWDFNLMQGQVDWHLMADGVHIVSEHLKAHTQEMRADNRFHLVLPKNNAPPFMDLYSRFESDDLSQVPRYYPVDKIKPDLLKWLDNAFVAGKAYNGHMVHYGRVKKGYFPFRNHRGNFAVSFQTDNAVIHYQDGWPNITQLDADVLFAGSGMNLQTHSAVLSRGMHVRNLKVSIADFKYPEVRLRGDVKGTTQPAIDFVMQSPLKESMGTALKYVEGRGDVRFNLAMQIPLQKDIPATYQGKLAFTDNNLRINFDDGYIDADGFNGQLVFDERQYTARNMRAMVLGNPVIMDVNTYYQGEQSSVVVTGKGRADAKTMARQTRVWLFDYLYGESDYEFTAVINNKNNFYQSSYVRLNSDTRGIHMNMPAPAYKESYQSRDLKVRWNIDDNLVNVQWGDELETSMTFAPEDQGGYLNRLALTLGKDEHHLPEQEAMLITGQLEHFSFKEWSSVINKELSSPDKMDKILPLQIHMNKLVITDIDYQMDKTGKVSKQIDLERVPDVMLDIKDLHYGKKGYGHLTVEMQALKDRFEVKQLKLQHPLLNFNAQGQWVLGQRPYTQMTMDIQSKNVGQLLKMFGFSATMTGELRANANLNWDDELYNFKMEDLEGALGFTITQGAFQDIEPGVGRVMGLFSFQALPRRLALDFSDFFSAGYHFDQIKGDFVFDDGEALSERISIQAPSARVVMSGTTDLVRKTYDYDVIIIPGDGSNLFMAGLLAGGLQTGFVVWAIERMVRVDKYTRLIYHLGGTWDKPDIKNLTETGTN